MADVSADTIVRLESGKDLKARTVAAVKRAFEEAGLVFVDRPQLGVLFSEQRTNELLAGRPEADQPAKASAKGEDKGAEMTLARVGSGRAKREATKKSASADTLTAPALQPHVEINAASARAGKLAAAKAALGKSPAEMVAASRKAACEVQEILREEAPVRELRRVPLGGEFD